jgi:radical SAM protein with 4Fe4S-binding SPASM domain
MTYNHLLMSPSSRLARSFLPATAVLELSYACNQACIFCSCPWSAPAGSFEQYPLLSVDDWRGVITRLCAMGVTDICFTGGEPLLYPGLRDLIEHAAACSAEHVRSAGEQLIVDQRPPRLTLLTNGLAMSDEILVLCRRHEIHLGLSLPGLATFRQHTGAGDAESVLSWFRRARREGVRTHVGITVTRLNLHELADAMTAALHAGADEVLLNRFLPGGRGITHNDRLMLDLGQIREMLEVAERVLRRLGRRGNVGTELPRCAFDPKRYRNLTVASGCAAALDFFVVDPSGHLRVCNHSPERLAHYTAIDTVKDHPTWRRFIARDLLPRECGDCAFAHECAGGCREAARIRHGTLDALDPLFERSPPRPFVR